MTGIECAFVGTLMRDADHRTGKSGKPFTLLSVAVGDGEARQFISIIAFNDAAASTANLSKGRRVYIEGKLETSAWIDKSGAVRHGLKVVALTAMEMGRIGRHGHAVRTSMQSQLDIEVIDELTSGKIGTTEQIRVEVRRGIKRWNATARERGRGDSLGMIWRDVDGFNVLVIEHWGGGNWAGKKAIAREIATGEMHKATVKTRAFAVETLKVKETDPLRWKALAQKSAGDIVDALGLLDFVMVNDTQSVSGSEAPLVDDIRRQL
jgi:single-stranded DNA-binding protein